MRFINKAKICWIDNIFFLFPPLWYPIISIITALVIYFLCILPLIVTAQTGMIYDAPIILGAAGIAWVCFCCRTVTMRYAQRLWYIHEILIDQSKAAFEDLVRVNISRMQNAHYDVVSSFCIWAIGILITALVWCQVINVPELSFLLYMPTDWYDDRLIAWRLTSISILAFPVVILTFTSGRIFIIHNYIIICIGRLYFYPSQRVCLHAFKALLKTSLMAAITWSVGVSMFGMLLVSHPAYPAVVVLGGMGSLGALGFCMPIYVLFTKLRQIRDWRVKRLIMRMVGQFQAYDEGKDALAEVQLMESWLADEYKIIKEFLGWDVIVVLVGSGIIPIVSTIMQIKMQK